MEDKWYGFLLGLLAGSTLALPAYFYGKFVVSGMWKASLEAIRRRHHMDVIIMDDMTSAGSVTPEMQEKINHWYTTIIDRSAPGELTKGGDQC